MEEAAELPLDRLAHRAGVSQPTVLRMLKALGFDGYKDFRYQLVAELARLQPGQDQADQLMYGYTLSRQDTLEEIPSYMTATAAGMMEETLKNFSVKTYRKAVEAIRKARLIDIYSVENSGVAAQDLLAKLLYLGLPCRYFSDSYYQREERFVENLQGEHEERNREADHVRVRRLKKIGEKGSGFYPEKYGAGGGAVY